MSIRRLASPFRIFWLLLVILPLPGMGGTSTYQSKIWPEHTPYVDQAKQNLQHWYDNADLADAEAEALALLKQALSAAPKTLEMSTLVGQWRVRSLQGASYGLFLYPYFKSSIRADGEGRYWFEKTTGSQRRSGHMYPDGDRLVFLGTSTVNEDPQGIYRAKTAPGPAENETVGVVWQLSANHLIMLLDAETEHFEIYELRR